MCAGFAEDKHEVGLIRGARLPWPASPPPLDVRHNSSLARSARTTMRQLWRSIGYRASWIDQVAHTPVIVAVGRRRRGSRNCSVAAATARWSNGNIRETLSVLLALLPKFSEWEAASAFSVRVYLSDNFNKQLIFRLISPFHGKGAGPNL